MAKFVLGFVLTVGLYAQVQVPDANAGSGPINSIPLGGRGPTGSFQNLRTQIRVPATYLPSSGATITDLGFATASDGTYSYGLLEVRLGHLAGTELGTNFTTNLANETLVLRRADARVSTGLDRWSSLGLSGSFQHDGRRDLVVDLMIQRAAYSGDVPGSRRSTTLETVYALAYDPLQPASASGPFLSGAKLAIHLGSQTMVLVGEGCRKADQQPVVLGWQGSARLGTSLLISATAAPTRANMALFLGQNELRFGSLSLPFDLAPLGAAGCVLRTDVVMNLPLTADAGGNCSLNVPIANDPSLRGQRVLFQWACAAPGSNALGIVLTAALRATIQ